MRHRWARAERDFIEVIDGRQSARVKRLTSITKPFVMALLNQQSGSCIPKAISRDAA
jgi:hypothetical protein